MDLLKDFVNAVFPQKCVGCGKAVGGETVCADCFSGIPINSALFCGKCRARLPLGKRTCHKDFPYVLGAATDYGNATVKNLIHQLKFNYIRGSARPLGKLLAKYASSLPIKLENFVVVPVPLSAKRFRERGFNQSELIAKIFSEKLGLSLETKALLRPKYAKPQSEARGSAERKENVRGCFSVSRGELIRGKDIILIDDVTTSGATFLEAATTLKHGGARRLLALAIARA